MHYLMSAPAQDFVCMEPLYLQYSVRVNDVHLHTSINSESNLCSSPTEKKDVSEK